MTHARRLLVLCCVLVLAAGTAIAAKKVRMMSITQREGQLRSAPSVFGKVVATLSYGDHVEVAEEKGAWFKVRSVEKKCEGWAHESALTKLKIILKPTNKDVEVAATSDELALANKGFNKEIEEEFKKKNKDIDFSWIDKMEKMGVSLDDMKAFMKAGKLELAEGGVQ